MVMTRDEVEAHLETFDDDRDAWLARRRKSLGGSDLFPIIYPGQREGAPDPGAYSSEWALWAGKVHGEEAAVDDGDKPWLDYGNDCEGSILAFTARHLAREDSTLELVPYNNAIFPDPTGAPMHFSMDGLIYRRPRWELVGGVDAKRVNVFHHLHALPEDQWGDEGSSQMPRRNVLQGVSGCMHFDVKSWVFAADRGTVPEMFPIMPDPEECAALRDVCSSWWQRHVVEGVEPAVDGSKSTTETLAALFSRPTALMLEATDEDLDLADAILEAHKHSKAAGAAYDELRNRMKRRIGEARGIKGVATWSECKGRKSLDTSSLAIDLERAFAEQWVKPVLLGRGMDEEEARAEALAEARLVIQAAVIDNTTRGEPYRRFTLSKK